MVAVRRFSQKEWFIPLLLIVPSLIFLILIFVVPVIQAGFVAFPGR